jgi:hypothetical protein
MHPSTGFRLCGEDPVDVAAPWPFTTALRDLCACRHACVFEDSSTGPLTFTYVQVRATLLTLTPSSDAFRSLPPGSQAGLPLLGMSKDRPSIVQAAESVSRAASDSRRRSSCCALRDGECRPHPRSVLVVSHHLDGFSSTTLRPCFRPLPILGFIAFRSVCETDSSRCTYRPSKLSLRRQLRELRRRGLRFCAGSRHRVDLDTCVPSIAPFTANLAPSSFLGPRGLAPSSGPLLARPLPAARARCSLGLVRSVPSPSCSPPPHRER